MSDKNRWFEDFTVGAVFPGSHRRTVTEAELVQTVALAGFRFPLFVDAEWCKENIPGGVRRFPGFVTLGIANGLCEDVLGHNHLGVRVIERVLFHGSMKPGDTMHARATVERKDAGNDATKGTVTFKVELFNHANEPILEFYPVFTIRKRGKP